MTTPAGDSGDGAPPPQPDLAATGTSTVASTPDQLREFSGKAARLGDAISRMQAELLDLQHHGMSVGSGKYAWQITQFCRNLIGREAVPAAGVAVSELEKMQREVSGSADQWEQTDQASASQWRA
ncbi:MAG: hypothetical protein M3308_09080 [Actinomycetota bacterium]|nr:hypothetical protein [Actinomycetota bacterium]